VGRSSTTDGKPTKRDHVWALRLTKRMWASTIGYGGGGNINVFRKKLGGGKLGGPRPLKTGRRKGKKRSAEKHTFGGRNNKVLRGENLSLRIDSKLKRGTITTGSAKQAGKRESYGKRKDATTIGYNHAMGRGRKSNRSKNQWRRGKDAPRHRPANASRRGGIKSGSELEDQRVQGRGGETTERKRERGRERTSNK